MPCACSVRHPNAVNLVVAVPSVAEEEEEEEVQDASCDTGRLLVLLSGWS